MHSSDSSQEIEPGSSASFPSHRTSLRHPHPRPRTSLILATLLLAIARPAIAASPQPSPPPSLAEPARSWAVDCAANEVLVVQHPGSYLRYRFHEVTEKGDQLRDQIETPDGSVARLIQRDGRPLTPEEDAAERQRLNDLLASPSDFFRHVHREQDNKKLGVHMLTLMPDAMLWSYAPGQPPPPSQSSAQPSTQLAPQPATDPALIVLDFKPNPKWSPPDMESETLTGLEGRVWIDARTRRVVQLQGDVFRPVNIGWGMVAHLYPGGTVTLHQSAAPTYVQSGAPPSDAPQRFIVDHIDEQLTVRALMVRTVKQRLIYDTANFQPVPPMTYQQAIKLLLDTPLPTH
jgi:hypothetical protein